MLYAESGRKQIPSLHLLYDRGNAGLRDGDAFMADSRWCPPGML